MPTHRSRAAFAAAASMLAVVTAGSASASPASTTNFKPYAQFVQGLVSARAQDYVRAPNSAVKDAASFEEMRHYLIGIYGSVRIDHSFAQGSQVFDCMRVMDQPSLRGAKSIATPPPYAPHPVGRAASQPDMSSMAHQFNDCPAGTIAFRRITLDELAHFGTLRQFFKKDPPQRAATQVHYYAHAYQNVKNSGSYAIYNLWKPVIDKSATQVFSLSQTWVTGGSGNKLQTAETGWQVYPAKYGTKDGVLFIYWTADAYNKVGCYNLECQGFVQLNTSKVVLGGSFDHYSQAGGNQREIVLNWYHWNSAWWLWYQKDWVGYYPDSVYNGGQLTKQGQVVDFGGETVGTTSWPGMGGSQFPAQGFGNAAYDRSIWWVNDKNQGTSITPTNQQNTPSCFKISETTKPGDTSWTSYTYFYFGGPGGKNCH